MKKQISILIAAMLILMISVTALAETVITVSGNGETQVSADTAVVTLGVNIRDKEVLKAQQKVNEKIAGIRKALIALNVEEECINTNYINIYAIYDYENDQEQIRAYEAGSSLSIKVTDMESVGLVIDASFAEGANTLEGIAFFAGDTASAQAESLTKAVADAKTKAETLAAASGMKITGIRAINEGGTYSYNNTVGNFAADTVMTEEEKAYGESTVVQAAKVIVSATVSISYTAE